ncbi:hypothetical protein IPL68_03750 [Candidatus Saccharibacteria bacterium]|nr:MAG: hypothetical protein IPL68_03750 [Candidatus Saccharibacteria bacterium]
MNGVRPKLFENECKPVFEEKLDLDWPTFSFLKTVEGAITDLTVTVTTCVRRSRFPPEQDSTA